ncbi:hypothetical protein EV426DRAFT_707619 [Tirmania nivea]|nr:hypothetical protein EV426DRAFT_707619 [Tirmania nivea]
MSSSDRDINFSGSKAAVSQPQQQPAPFTPPRPSISSPSRLSLQMPGRGSPSQAPDPALGYSAVRRPRLDFARACTSLHHSTLAEKSSPELSPQSGGGAVGSGSGGANQQHQQPSHYPSNFPSYGTAFLSSTAPSLDGSNHGDDSSTDDDDLDLDPISSSTTQTPTSKPFKDLPPMDPSPLALMNSHQAMQAAVLMRNPKGRLRLGPSRGSGSSGSGSGSNSRLASPSPTTPPPMGISGGGGGGGGYFGRGVGIGRRRDSLSQAIRDSFSLQGEEGIGTDEEEKKDVGTEPSEAIKRVVTRRGNLLPKTKNFQRIKAALQEESTPLDIEVKREAEVTRQLREDDDAKTIKNSILPSPQLLPIEQTLDPEELDEGVNEDEPMGGGSEIGVSRKNSTSSRNGSLGGGDTMAFNKRAQMFGTFNFDSEMNMGSNGGWSSPPRFPPREREPQRTNSDGDVVMDNGSPVIPVTMKRRRTQEERFEEVNSFKRRAVSPGLCGSPILTGSPASGGSGGNTGGLGGGGKRLNFGQGISDTHDGLMKMSLQ